MSSFFYDTIFNAALGKRLGYLSKPQDGLGIAQGAVTTKEALLTMMTRLAGWNFYFCPNTTRSTGKPTISDIIDINWVVLDFDPYDKRAVPEDIVDWASGEDILGQPRFVVDSGRGVHLWYRAHLRAAKSDEYQPSNQEWQARLTQFVRNLSIKAEQDGLPAHLDTTCADISHVFRAPESTNLRVHKYCYVLSSCTESSTIITESILPVPQPPRPVVLVSPTSILEVITAVPYTVRDFLLMGVRTHLDGRHAAAFAAGAALAELGVDTNTASELVRAGAARCTPQLSDWERPFYNGYQKGKSCK